MAFADTIRTTSATMSGVATLLESLLVSYAQDYDTSIQSTSSTSATDITGTSISLTVPTGGVVLLMAHCSMSHGTSNSYVHLTFARDSTNLTGDAVAICTRSDTAGGDVVLTNFIIDTPTAGTYTYKPRFYTNTGTVYALNRRIMGAVLRIS